MLLNGLSERLTESKRIPWRFRHLGGPLNTLLGAPLRRRKFTRLIKSEQDSLPDDITLIIGIKGRANYRLSNTLQSIRLQSYPQNLIKIQIVDYDNNEADSRAIARLCGTYGAETLKVDNREVWNRSHCLNVALRRAVTKFVMPMDADILLSNNFVQEVVEVLRRHPMSMVLSEMLDLPEQCSSFLEEKSKGELTADMLLELRARTKLRKTHSQLPEHQNMHISLHATYAIFYKVIRGYDEYYKLWGSEDNDMFRRLCYFGLTPRSVQDVAFYMHQWHPKHESLPKEELREVIRANHQYFVNNYSIIRNEKEWGSL